MVRCCRACGPRGEGEEDEAPDALAPSLLNIIALALPEPPMCALLPFAELETVSDPDPEASPTLGPFALEAPPPPFPPKKLRISEPGCCTIKRRLDYILVVITRKRERLV